MYVSIGPRVVTCLVAEGREVDVEAPVAEGREVAVKALMGREKEFEALKAREVDVETLERRDKELVALEGGEVGIKAPVAEGKTVAAGALERREMVFGALGRKTFEAEALEAGRARDLLLPRVEAAELRLRGRIMESTLPALGSSVRCPRRECGRPLAGDGRTTGVGGGAGAVGRRSGSFGAPPLPALSSSLESSSLPPLAPALPVLAAFPLSAAFPVLPAVLRATGAAGGGGGGGTSPVRSPAGPLPAGRVRLAAAMSAAVMATGKAEDVLCTVLRDGRTEDSVLEPEAKMVPRRLAGVGPSRYGFHSASFFLYAAGSRTYRGAGAGLAAEGALSEVRARLARCSSGTSSGSSSSWSEVRFLDGCITGGRTRSSTGAN